MSDNNSRNISGNSTSNSARIRYPSRNFTPMSPVPENPGFNPSYIPPQRRGNIVFGEIERPASAQSLESDDSFVSQIPTDGGVSLNGLLYGQHGEGTKASSGVASGSGGNVGGYGQGQGQGQVRDTQRGVGVKGSFGGHGGMDTAIGSGAHGALVGYGRRGSLGDFSALSISGSYRGAGVGATETPATGSYSFGNLQLPVNQAPDSILTPTARGFTPAFGAIGAGIPSTRGDVSNSVTMTSSANDSLRGGHDARVARDLANIVRAGLTDFGDDDAFDPTTGRFRGRPWARPEYAVQNSTAHTSTASTVLAQRSHGAPVTAELDPAYKSALVVARAHNNKGNAAAFVGVDMMPLPSFFGPLERGMKPSLNDFYFSMPVTEACRTAVASNAGVIRIHNIPFTTPRAEITAFVGRNAQIINQPGGSPYFAVHVIVERHTGKTMDAFVEFTTAGEAQYVVSHFNRRMLNGRHPRIGDRFVDVEISSQEELMAAMFPRAKNVLWEGATPRILNNNEEYYPGVPSAGFTGFMQSEEIYMVTKHAEVPHRSPFAARAIIRIYEYHISTLHKYPWFAHEAVTMTERRLIFDCTMALGKILIQTLQSYDGQQVDTTKPTSMTLQEYTVAVLTCPGFSEQQKAAYVNMLIAGRFGNFTSSRGMNLVFGGVHPLSSQWPFQVLAIKPSAHNDLIYFFAALMREATVGGQRLTLAQQHSLRESGATAQGPFGYVKIDYGNAKTLSEVAQVELDKIEQLLRRVLH